MEVRSHSSFFFQNKAEGIILDNAYDLYLRNRYLDYVKNNKINYIYSQDVDMNMITFFPDIEFLTVPSEVENLEALYNLKKLKGLEIPGRCLDELDLVKFDNLQYLLVRSKPKKLNNIANCKKLKALNCQQWDIVDVSILKELSWLKSLSLDFCGRLQSLNGLESLINLEEVSIECCLKLRNIDELKTIRENLKTLCITDCNKIENFEVLSVLYNLQILRLTGFQTQVVNKLPSLKFINDMPRLIEFMTDYKIQDGDLTPLLKINEVDILKFYKHYNLREDSFK